jgi:hypothetical protein
MIMIMMMMMMMRRRRRRRRRGRILMTSPSHLVMISHHSCVFTCWDIERNDHRGTHHLVTVILTYDLL